MIMKMIIPFPTLQKRKKMLNAVILIVITEDGSSPILLMLRNVFQLGFLKMILYGDQGGAHASNL